MMRASRVNDVKNQKSNHTTQLQLKPNYEQNSFNKYFF